jgi:hypothetical protein
LTDILTAFPGAFAGRIFTSKLDPLTTHVVPLLARPDQTRC